MLQCTNWKNMIFPQSYYTHCIFGKNFTNINLKLTSYQLKSNSAHFLQACQVERHCKYHCQSSNIQKMQHPRPTIEDDIYSNGWKEIEYDSWNIYTQSNCKICFASTLLELDHSAPSMVLGNCKHNLLTSIPTQ